jgi:hypothetical protein
MVILPAALGAAVNPVTIGGHVLEIEVSAAAGRVRPGCRLRGAGAHVHAVAQFKSDRRTADRRRSHRHAHAYARAHSHSDTDRHAQPDASTDPDGNISAYPIRTTRHD